MKKIIIISKAIVGARPAPFGYNGIFLKKSLREKLQDKLNKYFKDNNIDYMAETDESYKDIKELIAEGYDKVLISPYIKDKIDLKNIDNNKYYVLTYEEFNDCIIDNIINSI